MNYVDVANVDRFLDRVKEMNLFSGRSASRSLENMIEMFGCYNLVYEFSRIVKQPRAFPHRRDLLCKCDTISILLKLSISIDKPFLGNDANRCTLIVISA